MLRDLLFSTCLLVTSASIACDADVLRLNYRKTAPAKPAATPPATAPKATNAVQGSAAPSAPLTAFIKLGLR